MESHTNLMSDKPDQIHLNISLLKLFILAVSGTYLLAFSGTSSAETQTNSTAQVGLNDRQQQTGTTIESRTEKSSISGKYRVSYTPLTEVVPLNTMHTWRVYIVDAITQNPVTSLQLHVTGGMPAHGHGLPTRPVMTHEGTPGTYFIEGLQFHMPGQWTITFDISSQESHDKVTFEFNI